MHVGTTIKPLLPGRPGAAGPHWRFAAADVSIHHAIFKKTPFVSGLHPVSRDVVKDIPEIISIPLLTTTVLDQVVSQGFAIAGRTTAENSTSMTPYSYQSVLRSADERTAACGDVVGVQGNKAIDTSFTVTSLNARISNGKLTDRGLDACKSGRAARATNAWLGIRSIFLLQNRFAIAGASFSGGDLENHSYADV